MMNGMERISEKIMTQAREQAETLVAEAERQARDIAAQADARVTRETAEAKAASQTRVADIAEKARLADELALRKTLQNERQALTDETFSRALQSLINLPDAQYRSLLVSLIERAAADGEGGELLLNARDRAAHGEAVLAAANKALSGVALTLADEDAPLVGGVVIRRGKIELNSALDVLVRMLSEQSAYYVSNALFKEGA